LLFNEFVFLIWCDAKDLTLGPRMQKFVLINCCVFDIVVKFDRVVSTLNLSD